MREELFKNCTLCPRKCNVNRLEGKEDIVAWTVL